MSTSVDPYTYRCGCSPTRGVICPAHCQWQGCTDTAHTERCVRGERLPDRRGS